MSSSHKWSDIDSFESLRLQIEGTGKLIREGRLDLGKAQYSLCLLHGVYQAILSGYQKISAVEFGVAEGHGLLDLCRAAEFFSAASGIDIEVYGLDSFQGLPKPIQHFDHPEIWTQGQFYHDPEILKKKLPDFARLLIGDVSDTVGQLESVVAAAPLAFVSLDLDFYTSTRAALSVFRFDQNHYVPAVPTYVDDVFDLITYNEFSGAEKALVEFTQGQDLRKIVRKPNFGIHNFFVTHILDHPIRNGLVKPKFQFEIAFV